MEDDAVSDRSFSVSGSESKSIVGDKRSSTVLGEKSELGHKRVKMRDLESVFRSKENIEKNHQFLSVEKEKSQVSKETATTNSAQGDITRRITLPTLLNPPPRPLDLNTKVCVANKSADGSFGKHDKEQDISFATSKGFGWDLNAEDVSRSLDQDPFIPYKNFGHLKSVDASECGSTTGPLEDNDPMTIWQHMKQNGFLSSSHGGIQVPKPRGRKSKSDGPKKKMEIAKREQVDRFAKIAAPSGLLNELNPGIINHVRNSKQVLSIIEAVVRSEKHENRHSKSGTKEIIGKGLENANGLGTHKAGLSHEDGSLSTLSGSQQKRGCPVLLSGSVYFKPDCTGGDGESSKFDRKIFVNNTCLSPPNQQTEDDLLVLKLSSSSAMASEDISSLSLSNEESANLTSVSSLSVKAANVASQWLELLSQDIKGRLSALQRSKKRVQAVINTELPFLISQEFSSNQENNPYAMKDSAARCCDNANADVHRARWSALFDQMDKALCEEEKQLESWLNQVKEMQLHCEQGLRLFHCNASYDSRLEEADNSERELAVRAAAASIYSTCNFLLSMENLPCF